MRGGKKKQIVAILFAALCTFGITIIGFSIIFPPSVGISEGQFLPRFLGYYYVSDIQDSNGNISYSVVFHDVNFTFLYWYWSEYYVFNNITAWHNEQPVSVFVQVTFQDNSSEILTIVVDSPGSCLIGIDPSLSGVTSSHLFPKAGLASAETEELQGSWVYIVSI